MAWRLVKIARSLGAALACPFAAVVVLVGCGQEADSEFPDRTGIYAPPPVVESRSHAVPPKPVDLDDVHVVSAPVRRATLEDVARVARQLRITFPPGYEQYVTTFGAGDFCGEIRIYPPEEVVQQHHAVRELSWQWDPHSEILSPEQVEQCYIFGEDCGPAHMLYYQGDPPGIYVIEHEESDFEYAGKTLPEALTWMLARSSRGKSIRTHYFRPESVVEREMYVVWQKPLEEVREFLLESELGGRVAVDDPLDLRLLVLYEDFAGEVRCDCEGPGVVGIWLSHDGSRTSPTLTRIREYFDVLHREHREAVEAGEDVPSIERFHQMEWEDPRKTDESLAEMARLFPRLRTLTLWPAAKITDEGCRSLARLAWLGELQIFRQSITDEGLVRLKSLSLLRSFRCDELPITHQGLECLEGMPRLEQFVLYDCPVDGPGMAAIRICQGLQHLNLSRCGITDDSTVHLEGLKELRGLFLPGNPITDAGLAPLSGLNRIERLGLSDTRIRGPGLVHLANCPRLKHVYLDNTPMDDESLQYLQGWKDCKLDTLVLRGTRITDRGLKTFESWTRLRTLVVENTAVTDRAAADLQSRLPQLRALWGEYVNKEE